MSALPLDAAGSGWEPYWEQLDDRQRLFREQSAEYVRNVDAAGLLGPSLRVLDFGCGFGYVARGLAPRVGALCLWDASANMRRQAMATIAGLSNARLLDLSTGQLPAAEAPFDRILVNSVVQYMSPTEIAQWLARWRSMLAPRGLIVVSDLIPPHRRASADVLDLLKFAARRGFLAHAVWEALGAIGGYCRRRRAAPVTRLAATDLAHIAGAADLAVTVLRGNVTHFRGRLTAVFSLRAAAHVA